MSTTYMYVCVSVYMYICSVSNKEEGEEVSVIKAEHPGVQVVLCLLRSMCMGGGGRGYVTGLDSFLPFFARLYTIC